MGFGYHALTTKGQNLTVEKHFKVHLIQLLTPSFFYSSGFQTLAIFDLLY